MVSTKQTTTLRKIFVLYNNLLFFIGVLITFGFHVFNLPVFRVIWSLVSQSNWTILFLYTSSWVVIGYQYGTQFGVRGKTLLTNTIQISIIPNLMLMLSILYGFVPIKWFDPILTTPFLVVCILATILFFPFSQMGYCIGKQKVFN